MCSDVSMKNFCLTLLLTLLSACSNPPPSKAPLVENGATDIKPHVSDPPIKLGPPSPLKQDPSVLVYPAEFNDLPGWHHDDHARAFSAFQRSCSIWRKQSDHQALSGIFNLGTIGDWKRLCAQSVNHGDEKRFFEQWFKPYAVSISGSFDGLFTGYYLPELHGSYRPSVRYHVPIYGVPKDLVKRGNETGRLVKGRLEPYYDRAAITAGALSGRKLELLWVDSDIDAFFMEIQGSGRVIMEDGSVRALSYADKNGRAYYAIGKTLVDRGEIAREAISMQSIRSWIQQHPQEGRLLMQQNASYVFFKFNDKTLNEGPVGSMATPLTAGYSLAVDKHFLPMGVPLWLDAEHPSGAQRLRRLVMAQDTGGAIKGLIRGDVYWGQGEQAADWAGTMKSRGRYFLLVPKYIRLG
ncbi:MAG: rane-bound lytic murein transglycosylase [Pseudomonadota bacterium]|jgi:membrane-bound lytic murein transglycosylase A